MIEHLDGIFETVSFQENLGVRVNFMDFPENFPDHWHTPMEIIRSDASWYKIVVEGRDFILQQGDVAIIRPGIIHALYAPEKGSRTIYLADLTAMQKFANIETLLALQPPVKLIRKGESDALHRKLSKLLAEIEEEYAAAHPFYELFIYSKLMELLALMGRSGGNLGALAEAAAAHSTKYAARLLDVCNYVNAHCTEELTLDAVADYAGFSKYHFTRLFKQFTQTTFYQYVNKKRIAHAEQMLTNPEYSVTEVALNCGFSSLSAFIRMFKQLKGCTPTEFRSMYSPNGAIHARR